MAPAGLVVVAAVAVQLVSGEWYFGHHPQYVLIIDSGNVEFGKNDELSRGLRLHGIVAIALEIAVVTVPIWAVARLWRRKPRPPVEPSPPNP